MVKQTSEFYAPPGLGKVGAYQVAAIPWVSSSLPVPNSAGTPVEISFYNVTRFFTVRNTLESAAASSKLRVGFAANGVKAVEHNNYFTLDNGESYSGDFKITKLYLLGDGAVQGATASIVAGLTSIQSIALSASANNWSGTSGVG